MQKNYFRFCVLKIKVNDSITHPHNQFCVQNIYNKCCVLNIEVTNSITQVPTQPIPKVEVNNLPAGITWSSKSASSSSSSIGNKMIITLSQILMTRRSWSGSRAAVVPACGKWDQHDYQPTCLQFNLQFTIL